MSERILWLAVMLMLGAIIGLFLLLCDMVSVDPFSVVNDLLVPSKDLEEVARTVAIAAGVCFLVMALYFLHKRSPF